MQAWLGAAVILAASTAAAAGGRLLPGERAAFDAVNGLPGPPFVVDAVRAVMVLGTLPAALAVIVAVAAATRRLRPAAAVAAAYLPVRVLTDGLKAAVHRPRPSGLVPVEHLRAVAHGQGFPSGHTANSVVLALAVGLVFPRLRWPLLGVAAAISLARAYVGVHLPLDLVGGAALAVLGSSLAWAAGATRYVPRR